MGKSIYILLLSLFTCSFSYGQGVSCASADPFCTSTALSFPNNTGVADAETTEPGNDYDCLDTSPNPAWYYMEIGTSGNLIFDIEQTSAAGSGLDVDFILYGPYNDLTQALNYCGDHGNANTAADPNQVVDCSYSTSAQETANIGSATTGDVYLMLITNFSNQAGTITFEQTGGSGSTNSGIVLPVELISFYGDCNNDFVQLEWSTSTEINNAYFTIERSLDAVNYTPIATINGNGSTNNLSSYSYIDNDVLKQAYYRLKQTDFNGDYKYFSSIFIECESDPVFSLYPNPFKEEITITVTKPGNYKLKIEDYLGRNVFSKTLERSLLQKISLRNLQTQGMYFASLYNQDGKLIFVEKIFKQ